MRTKLLTRLFCALLSVLMLVCAIPAITVSAAQGDAEEEEVIDYTNIQYADENARIAAMDKMIETDDYELYCDKLLGIVAYRKKATGEILFSNPWNMKAETNSDEQLRGEMMSQIVLTYLDSKGKEVPLNSYTDAALKGQITVKTIKNGVRVEYTIGERSARILVPRLIERSALEEKILKPIEEACGKNSTEYRRVSAQFNEQFYKSTTLAAKKEAIGKQYPVAQNKNIDLYAIDANISTSQLREIEEWIMKYCPDYTFEEMDNDHSYVEYVEESVSPPVFRMALEYKLDARGMTATLPANGLRYDETAYRIIDLQILPYMGASNKNNEGYSFIPDGSGTLYELDTPATISSRVYGEDYALVNNVSGLHNEPIRMPVFGQVETLDNGDGTTTKRGYLAIIEEGEALASIAPSHLGYLQYATVIPSFITRQSDVTASDWTVYACRRYTDDYKIRYVMLSDDAKAQAAGLSSYYECSWMGMAFAYRDYLAATNKGYQRLTSDDVKEDIPLYIETFGCMDTVKKVLSMPVTVSVALTSFEDVRTMYDYLAGEGVVNVNFKLRGYANGGLYSDVPYKLKWERSVGGASGFEELTEYAAEQGFGLFPDFDFVYTTQSDGGNAVNMKKNAARTVDNRYTSRRVYSATKQVLVSYYQMVLSPATYERFYEKLGKKYAKYENATGISLGTLGNSLNSDFDENKTVLREEAKEYVIETLSYFKDRYDIMLDGGNAFTWGYADHILNVPLDSSRYNAELSSVPFMGVVLHGYVEFAGSALNMEGDLSYAMLKAIENGASVYFVLSYANTELLKEDPLLSQNYSVRYDIWQERLVAIYEELNAVLADVQTKLIIDHQILSGEEYSHRVPDEKELMEDIADRAEQAAKELEAKIEAERLEKIQKASDAKKTVMGAAALITANKGTITTNHQLINQVRAASGTASAQLYLLAQWQTCRDELAASGAVSEQSKKQLSDYFNMYVVERVARINRAVSESAAQVVAAKVAYDYLCSVKEEQGLQDSVIANAKTALEGAIDEYVLLVDAYNGTNVTTTIAPAAKTALVTGSAFDVDGLNAALTNTGSDVDVSTLTRQQLNDFLFNTTETQPGIGSENLYQAFVAMLVQDGFYDPANAADSVVNVKALFEAASKTPAPETTPDPEPDSGEGEGGEEGDVIIPDAPKSEYAVDNNIVLVTYGDKPGDPYKSFLLNFNDYAVQTTYNGVTYTIAGYDYIEIYY